MSCHRSRRFEDMDDVGIQLEFDGPVTVQAAPAGVPAANDADAAG